MIKVCNFSKTYNNSFSLENISFTVKPGSITGILGANGSGKTTLLKAICGFHFGKGDIIISDNKTCKINVNEQSCKAMDFIGYVPEISILPQDLYVHNFLDYAAKIHNISDSEKRITEVMELCQLTEVMNKKIKHLSKGYKQRLSFAQAIIHDPANIILDEPISGLDPVQIVQMRTLIKNLSKNKAILISTHILQEVDSLCQNLVILNNGKQIAEGTEKEILQKTKFNSIEELLVSASQSN